MTLDNAQHNNFITRGITNIAFLSLSLSHFARYTHASLILDIYISLY
jgi:hypothetical protein